MDTPDTRAGSPITVTEDKPLGKTTIVVGSSGQIYINIRTVDRYLEERDELVDLTPGVYNQPYED